MLKVAIETVCITGNLTSDVLRPQTNDCNVQFDLAWADGSLKPQLERSPVGVGVCLAYVPTLPSISFKALFEASSPNCA